MFDSACGEDNKMIIVEDCNLLHAMTGCKCCHSSGKVRNFIHVNFGVECRNEVSIGSDGHGMFLRIIKGELAHIIQSEFLIDLA